MGFFLSASSDLEFSFSNQGLFEFQVWNKPGIKIEKDSDNGLIKVDLEFSFSIPGLFQTWNSNKPGFEKLNSRSELELSKKTIIKWEKSSNLDFTAESCRKPKTNNQQLLRNNLKLQLKYEVNLRVETQIWKPGPDLKMKNLELKSWIPGLNLKKKSLKPWKSPFPGWL